MCKIVIYKDKDGNSDITEYIEKLSKSNGKDSQVKLNKIVAYY